ncbi:acyltransferase family protein [Bradyrhizobium lablabi]|uniref:acyltransferase family protein n=1 Tax=Bradyrhizobium lablabi TaxID=722472 RepID=UPI0015612746|nr:acyltransferase [Bradyrhizobium lablabi]
MTVQYLRALAATAVVVHHFVGPAYIDAGRGHPGTVGEAGVDLFFVISGFIMWTTTRRRETAPLDFIWHRIVRIVPLYWIFTLVFLGITLASKHSPVSTLDVMRSLFFVPWFEEDLGQKTSAFYFLGWTLMYEMFFYCVFAFALFLPRKSQFIGVVGCLSALVALGLVFDFKSGPSFTYTSPLLLEFMAGCAVGELYERKAIPSISFGTGLLCIGLATLIWTVWNIPYSLLARTLLWGAPAALILVGALSVEAPAARKPTKLFLLLGNASYSIYLSHIITLLVFNLIVKRAGLIQGFNSEIAIYSTIGSALALAGGTLVYALLERPVSNFSKLIAIPVKSS